MEIGYMRLQQVFDANMVELLKDPEVNLVLSIDSVGQLAGFYPGYDIVGEGMEYGDFRLGLTHLRVR